MRTSTPQFEEGTLNPYVLAPAEVLDRDRLGYKIIAVVSGPFWSCYRGGTGWSDEKVAAEGDPVPEAVAKTLFPALAHLIFSE